MEKSPGTTWDAPKTNMWGHPKQDFSINSLEIRPAKHIPSKHRSPQESKTGRIGFVSWALGGSSQIVSS